MQCIQNGHPNEDVARFQYRKLFHLSARQMEEEPIDEVRTALLIHREISKQEERESKHGSS